MTWFAIFKEATSELVSCGDVVDQANLDPSLTAVAISDAAATGLRTGTMAWDKATRAVIAVQPPVLVDRATEVVNDILSIPAVATVFSSLTVARQNTLKTNMINRVGTMLGNLRFRLPADSTDINSAGSR